MCICIVVQTNDWYILWSNRDDQMMRATDTFVTDDTVLWAKYVKDQQEGGTRLAIHTTGIYAVLLNSVPSVDVTLTSRGLLPLQIMNIVQQTSGDREGVMWAIQNNDRTVYNSCLLSIWGMQNNALVHTLFSWNAVSQVLEVKTHRWALFLSAPTLYDPIVNTLRWAIWTKCHTTASIYDFLYMHQYTAWQIHCIEKPWVITKSTSVLSYQENEVVYTYFPYQAVS